MTTCFVVANTKTEAANAILLQYTSTFWVFGLSPWVLGEKAAARDFAILLLAVAGIAVIFAGNADSDLAGLTIALGAGAAYGLLTLLLRLVRDCDPAAITVANNLGTALLLFPAVAVFGDLRVSFGALLLLMFMGVVQFGLPYYFFSLGLRRVPASQAALLTLTEPILVPVWAYLVVREPVPFTTLMGGGMILLALGVFLVVSRRPNTGASRMPTIDIRPAPPDNEPGNRSHAP
jgi:drug/metabolite transporter (DMT)-like permease